MEIQDALILGYVLFIWFVVLHTFEEIAQGIFELKLGKMQLAKNKYLLGASIITTVNLATLALLIAENPMGLYFGLFTTSVIGVLQFVVHGIGFIKEGYKTKNIAAVFYSSIPLSIVGAVLFYYILLQL